MTDSAAEFTPCAAPFDAVAEVYDDTFTASRIGCAQRAAVTRELDRVFRPGQRILEINCGTGVDAAHLGERGVAVLACDASPRMIEVARRRAARNKLGDRIESRVLATEKIGTLCETLGQPRFDGALSNFAGLNCVKDLDAVACNLGRLLKPRAHAVICAFGRTCLWEILWYLGQAKLEKAFRRFRREGSIAELTEGVTVDVHYPSVRRIAGAFRPYFRLQRWKGIGVAVPPSYLEPWAARFPWILSLLTAADRRLAGRPAIRALGDHVLLTLERKER